MATAEEIALSLFGGDTQKAIAAENPYLQFQNTTESVAPLFMQAYANNPTGKNLNQALIGQAVTGLLSGFLGGKGAEYQSTLTDRYTDAFMGKEVENLPAGLFAQAQQQKKLFDMAKFTEDFKAERELSNAMALENAKSKNDIGKTIIKELIRNGGMEAVGTTVNMGSEVAPPDPVADSLGIEPLEQRRAEKVAKYIAAGLPRVQASKAAEGDLGAELKADEAGYKRVEEQREKARTFIELADTVDAALATGLKTGAGAGLVQGAAELGAFVGVGGEERATAGQMLNTVKAKTMGMNRVVGSGATSDFDAKQYLMAGASLDKTTEANAEIARRMRVLAERNRDYADFVDLIRAKGGTIAQADKLWSKYERANPLWIKDQSGEIAPNDHNITPVSRFDFSQTGASPTGGGVPSVGSTFQGSKVLSVEKVE